MKLRPSIKFVQSGFESNRLLICIYLIIMLSLLTACRWFNADGFRGDWYLDIYGDYRLNRINSRTICIEKRDPKLGGIGGVKNYFVTRYVVVDSFICVEGIRTKEWAISQEELDDHILSYYIIDTQNDVIAGPFDLVDSLFIEYEQLKIPSIEDWCIVTDPPKNGNPY